VRIRFFIPGSIISVSLQLLNQSDISQYKRLCKSCQVNTESQDGRRERENYVLSIMKNISFYMGYVPLYMIRGGGYFL
jgi:hypothetical protein